VFVHKDESGKTTVRETIDPTPGRSALSGALWASLFGLVLGGPVGWIVGAGAGAVSAKVIDHGIPDEWVAWFREAVQLNTTTLALLVEELDRAALVEELSRFNGAQLVYANLDPLWVGRIHDAIGDSASASAVADDTPPTPN
jgi:uncharacterized membrane protein